MTEQNKETGWFEKFIDNLAKLLKEPPYHLFFFAGSIFFLVSLLLQKNPEQTWTFLLYSVGGIIWRYAERDFKTESGENTTKLFGKTIKYKLITYIIYHVGNIVLFLILLHSLRPFYPIN